MKLIIGSRDSQLAIRQAEIAIDALKEPNKDLECEILTMKTTGDRILDRTLDKIGGKGLFVKELEQALYEKRVDLTVHSLKDVVMEEKEELPLLAFSKREDPRDALVLPEGKTDLDLSKPIGTSSQRRIEQLKILYPEAEFKSIRGNLQTRLKKLDSGEFGGIVLAVSGLKRMGLGHRISKIFTVEEIIPAAGQGVLVIQGRNGFESSLLKNFEDSSSRRVALAERAFVRALDGGCSSPIGSYGEERDGQLYLTGFYVDESGFSFKKTIAGDIFKGEDLGLELADLMKNSKEGKGNQ